MKESLFRYFFNRATLPISIYLPPTLADPLPPLGLGHGVSHLSGGEDTWDMVCLMGLGTNGVLPVPVKGS